MSDDYDYPLSQCDVADKRALEQFRAKRTVWRSWLEEDEHHAIWSTIQQMVWTDVAFRSLTAAGSAGTSTALQNPLMAEALINGYFATQILAVRRLVDGGNSDIISLRRLLKDLKAHAHLLTREHYVCYDGLPYDFARVQEEEMSAHLTQGGGAIWAATSGRRAWHSSRMGHEQFDKVSKVSADRRQRDDRIASSTLSTIETWLNESGAAELGKWSNVYLAHAGGPTARQAFSNFQVTVDRISEAIRNLARVAEALGAYVLWSSGRLNALMATAQFDPFEGLEGPVMSADQQTAARVLWDQLSDDRDDCLASVAYELFR
ncbi:hypothetical protein [Bradyrhizobium liaoningense]|uniref:hypothetical protein n=1 Tax=Bradyrhizobium liaoningense TaxID=43992 RepID=UPI001BA69753|nr:hypothetical protein [Bradyrhizobium liaoningense]MBR0857827.1 hypothetical protein [Bradyrhizobium liaoningense]